MENYEKAVEDYEAVRLLKAFEEYEAEYIYVETAIEDSMCVAKLALARKWIE